MILKVKVLNYPCKGWCTGKTGEGKRYKLPEPGILVTFEGNCPHKGSTRGSVTCFMEYRLVKVKII